MASLLPESARALAAIAATSAESTVGITSALRAGGMVMKNKADEMSNVAVTVRSRMAASLEIFETSPEQYLYIFNATDRRKFALF
jgi:hypothetical protein